MTKRNSALEWLSVCKLAKCFDRAVRGTRTKCCDREVCSKPKKCRSVRAKPALSIEIPVDSDSDIDETVDLGLATFISNFITKKCIKIPDVAEDIYLISDQTRSMRSEISVVKARMQDIIDNRKTVKDVRFGVGSYGDETERNGGFLNRLKLTSDTTVVKAVVKEIPATGGGDTPEAGLVALHRAAKDGSIGWRSQAQKVIVLFGDAPQHEPTCVDGKTITRDDVIDVLTANDITVISIDVGSLNSKTYAFKCSSGRDNTTVTGGNQMIDISRFTKGEHRRTTKLSKIIDAIEDALNKLKLQFFIDTSSCSEAYDIRFNIPVPKAVMRGDEVCFKESIKFKPAACQNSVSKRCDVQFIASGPLLGTQTLKTDSIIGCQM